MPASGFSKPPSPPRLRSTNLPEDVDGHAVEPEPFLKGHPILPEDRDINDMSDAEIFRMNQEHLEQSMKSGNPLISPPEETAILRSEYSNSPNFLAQIDYLISRGYNIIIRAKGDGDCFYRALAFAYLDRLIRSPSHSKQDRLAATSNMLANAGFDQGVYGQPYEILECLVQLDRSELLQAFMDPETSNYIVMYMRLLASAQMRVDDQFTDFLFDLESSMQFTVDEFCRRFVEPLGKEADHVQLVALVQALKVHLQVAYLDGHDAKGHVNFVDFSRDASDGDEPLVLLYRPGHYDILQRSV